MLSCRGGVQAVRASLSCPPPSPGYQSKIILLILLILNYLNVKMYQLKHNSGHIQLFSLSHSSACLVAGVEGKLSMAFYLAPTHLSIKVKLFC